jgi:hypothetical protein
VLGAHCRAHSQFAHDSDNLNGYVRAIGPVTQVFREGFLSTVNNRSNRYLRHCSNTFNSGSSGFRQVESSNPAALYRGLRKGNLTNCRRGL